jgi:hypothetical protein
MSRNKTQIRPAGITAPGASALASLTLDAQMLKPGMRIAVGLSGGSDSVALLRALAACSGELGLVVHAAHLHHGLRGEEADGDLDFARDLAATLGLPFHQARVDVAKEAQSDAASGKAAETLEEAARRVRYAWFRQLLATEDIDAVATDCSKTRVPRRHDSAPAAEFDARRNRGLSHWPGANLARRLIESASGVYSQSHSPRTAAAADRVESAAARTPGPDGGACRRRRGMVGRRTVSCGAANSVAGASGAGWRQGCRRRSCPCDRRQAACRARSGAAKEAAAARGGQAGQRT